MNRLKRWTGRLAFVPLAVYALGTPLALFAFRTVPLRADGWLPLEIAGLVACAVLVVKWGLA